LFSFRSCRFFFLVFLLIFAGFIFIFWMMYFSSFIHVSFVAKSSHEFFICFSLHCIAVFEKLASFLWRVGIFYLFCICICFRFKICIFSSFSAISWVLRSFKVPVLFARFFAVGATQLCTHTLTAARMHAHLCKLQKLASAGKSSSMRVLYLRPSLCVCVCACGGVRVCWWDSRLQKQILPFFFQE